MASGREAYLSMILGLLPSGRAWTRDRYSVLVRFLGVFADTFVAVDLRVDDLMCQPQTAGLRPPEYYAEACFFVSS